MSRDTQRSDKEMGVKGHEKNCSGFGESEENFTHLES